MNDKLFFYQRVIKMHKTQYTGYNNNGEEHVGAAVLYPATRASLAPEGPECEGLGRRHYHEARRPQRAAQRGRAVLRPQPSLPMVTSKGVVNLRTLSPVGRTGWFGSHLGA